MEPSSICTASLLVAKSPIFSKVLESNTEIESTPYQLSIKNTLPTPKTFFIKSRLSVSEIGFCESSSKSNTILSPIYPVLDQISSQFSLA
jgi:hypothetical protein